MTTENKEIVQAFFQGLNERDLDSAAQLVSDDYVNHGMPGMPGRAGMRAVTAMFLTSFPDMHVTLADIIGEGDRVATRGRWTGTHQGDFMGIPTTGRSVEVNFIDLWRIENGVLVENWVQMDIMSLMQQLGVFPDPAAVVV